ncbi:5'-deoxyadenosine deaminase [Streptomyces sp. MBT84]|nr:5'-deoxyadenosine deaminase [Streptomyces sp. MBT84]
MDSAPLPKTTSTPSPSVGCPDDSACAGWTRGTGSRRYRDRIVMPGFVDNHRHTWQTALRGAGADWTFPSGLRPCTARSNPLPARGRLRGHPARPLRGFALRRDHDAGLVPRRTEPRARGRRRRRVAGRAGALDLLLGAGWGELRMLADVGSSLSISPVVELKVGFGSPMTGRAPAAGLRPALSSDRHTRGASRGCGIDAAGVGHEYYLGQAPGIVWAALMRPIRPPVNILRILREPQVAGGHRTGLVLTSVPWTACWPQ